MDEENIDITRKGNKFIVVKGGKNSVYKSVDDMPPDVRKKHEEFQALFKESFSDKTRYMEKEGRTLTFYVKGKTYNKLEDIPDKTDREYFLKKQQEEAPEFMVLPADKKKQAEKEKMSKLYDCPKCNKKVKSKKGFLGGLKCIECGAKLKV
ncbi:MAG: hypothetical protein ACFFG0_16785 [Candidatus Thorarchaeota archaeon]